MIYHWTQTICKSHTIRTMTPIFERLPEWKCPWPRLHYIDVIMTTMASQITSLMVVYATVYSDADQRKHQSSTSLAFVWGIHRDRWIPRTKRQLRGKCFHLMTSSCGNLQPFLLYGIRKSRIYEAVWWILWINGWTIPQAAPQTHVRDVCVIRSDMEILSCDLVLFWEFTQEGLSWISETCQGGLLQYKICLRNWSLTQASINLVYP